MIGTKCLRATRVRPRVAQPLSLGHTWTRLPVETITDPELKSLADSATNYLSNQSWCRSIHSCYLGYAVPAVLGVFLFRIVPARPGVESRCQGRD
jgi:hypothetical protein